METEEANHKETGLLKELNIIVNNKYT